MDAGKLTPWIVPAVNLPEHEDNPVHTDAGAQAAGYPRALVAGVSVYAYLSHVPAAAWGRAWLEHGGAEVRFRSPVFDDDEVHCEPVQETVGTTEQTTVHALVGGEKRASLVVQRRAAPPEPPGGGERLEPMVVHFDDRLATYGRRAGDDLGLYEELGVVHPAIWPVLGNRVTMAHLVTGPWIHVRSAVTHLGPAPVGAHALVESAIVDTFTSKAGERAVLDIRVSIDGRPVAAIHHESIVVLSPSM